MKYTKDVEKAIKKSKEIAIEIKSKSIRPEHLFLALIDNEKSNAYMILHEMNLNISAIKDTLKEWSSSIQSKIGFSIKTDKIVLDIETDKIINKAATFAEEIGDLEVDSQHVFFSILQDQKNIVTELFSKSPETYKKLKSKIKNSDDDFNEDNDIDMEPNEREQKAKSKNSKSLIEQFGTDLTKMAKEGKLDPVVGRKPEIKRISQILSRRKKNNPVLIGEPGVGKSAIVEGIAQMIFEGKVPSNLKDKRIVTLDMGSLVAGTKYRGEFEQRLRGIIKEMDENRNIVLFIDEIHTIIGAGSAQGSLDASNMLKPALSRGAFQCIGATTLEEYRKYIEKDGALERRFQKITVDPTTKTETYEILKNIKDKYEDHHSVIYTDDAIQACVDLTDKYMSEKFLPDKAIDALDEAGSKVHVNKTAKTPKKIEDIEKKIKKITAQKQKFVLEQKFELAANQRDIERDLIKELEIEKEAWKNEQSKNRDIVTKDDIAEVVALMTKIPVDNVSADENNKLKLMANKVKSVVIGQDEAIDKLVRAVKRARIGIKDPKRPVGSFIFLGPTGCGKCHGKGTKILMYDGSIKNVEDVLPGDLLMGDDSTPRKVLSLSRGKDKMYKITPLKGGDPWTCNNPHILSLKKTGSYEIVNIPLNEYLEKSKWFKHIHKLWRTNIEFTPKPVSIDPYFMGLWIGDGNSHNVGITTADMEIVDYIYDIAKKWDVNIRMDELDNNKSNVYVLTRKHIGDIDSNQLLRQFQKYGLITKNMIGDKKFIPDDYLYNDSSIRKSLLAGLIDSDGYHHHNCYLFSTKYDKLADQVLFLCRSLGYMASKTPKIVNGKTYYSVNICGDLSDIGNLLSRKKSTPRKQKKNISLTQFKVDYIGIDDYYGFEIDGNHLYLLGDFTVTHNTYSAKVMAKELFGTEDSMIRIDMTEYMEKHSVSRLVGAPPGYVGYEDGGELTEAVRRKPYSIILFDEIEKAHPDVFNILLQLLDDGVLTDSYGRRVDFKNTIIIMTSNAGSRKLKDFGTGIGFASQAKNENIQKDKNSIIDKELKKIFSPEFLNRVDEVIMFNSLSKENIGGIVDVEVKTTIQRLKDIGYEINITNSLKDFLFEKGYDVEYGARPLKRAIQKYIEDRITDAIINEEIVIGDRVSLRYDKTLEEVKLVKLSSKDDKDELESKGLLPESAI
jgi:ATP-dependent Clp protease ATP-binding subunit ClpA